MSSRERELDERIAMTTDSLIAEIRARRRKLGLSQADLAGLAGLSVEGLSKIERGDAEPKVATLLQLVKLLGGFLELRWRT